MPADTTPDLMTMSVICGLYIYNSNTFNKSHKPFLVSSQHYCMKKQYDSHEDVKLRSNEKLSTVSVLTNHMFMDGGYLLYGDPLIRVNR